MGFLHVCGVLSYRFQELLNDVLGLCCIIHCHWTGINEDSLPDRHWVINRSYFVEDKLIAFKEVSVTGSPVLQGQKVQDCIRLALIVWLAFVPASTPYARDAGLPALRAAVDAKALRNRLERILADVEMFSIHLDVQLLLFWVAALGAVASEVVADQEWFAVQFQRLAKKLGIFTWYAFQSIQERFLILDVLKPGGEIKLRWLLQRAVHAEVGD